MGNDSIDSIARYKDHLKLTGHWLLKSVKNGNGGSCAHYSLLMGWSKPYPETTGYLIPTLLRLSDYLDDPIYSEAALELGQWLLDIQSDDGSWRGGLHPNRKADGSVFNTGQILKGMMALSEYTGEPKFLEAADKGANWLAAGVDDRGLWPSGDYRASETPSYYTHVAWPMLEVWKRTLSTSLRFAAERYLDMALERKQPNGVISRWGFNDEGAAFTHTIAYTIRGFQESARLIGDYDRYGRPMEQILNFFIKKSELRNGRIPGEFSEDLNENNSYVCLTGNAQLAICILLMEREYNDLRIVNSAAKMVDYVGSVQSKSNFVKGICGGVAGSHPPWGRYMFIRYPNWAAKYYCDSLMLLSARLKLEL